MWKNNFSYLYITILVFGSNQGQYRPRCDLDPPAEMSPGVGWNGLLVWGCFGLNEAQIASGEAESDFGQQGLKSWHFSAETDLFNLQGFKVRLKLSKIVDNCRDLAHLG